MEETNARGLRGQFSQMSIEETGNDAKLERMQRTLKQWKLAHEETRDIVRQRENESHQLRAELTNMRQRLHMSEQERTQAEEELQQLRQIVQAQSTERDITSTQSHQQIQSLQQQVQSLQAQLKVERKEKEEAQEKLRLLGDVMQSNQVPTTRSGLGDHVHGAPADEEFVYRNRRPAPAAAYARKNYPSRGQVVCDDDAETAYDEPDQLHSV